MKIGPTQRQPASSPTPAQPRSASFAGLLDAGGRASDAATGFQALGMFGRSAAVQASSTPASKAAEVRSPSSTPKAGATAGPSEGQAAARSDRGGAMTAAVREGAAARPATTVRARAVAEGPLPGRSPEAPGEGLPPEVEAFEGPLRAGGRRRAPSPPPRSADVRLAPTTDDDAAGVAVHAAGLSETEIAQFRVKARTVLREHGLSLDKVSVNGEDRTEIDPVRRRPDPWR
jgi:hypothetical protein